MIKASGLKPHAGIMTLVFDESKYPYRIPIACINDPSSYKASDADLVEKTKKPPEEDIQGLKIRSIGEQDNEFDVSSYTLISELKTKYLDEIDKADTEPEK
mmetsp:Transcript_12801/g.12810  ORF Transcript_12801/g.12810 Transcript_12801/m.12810 type:complete len:101 (-) Transcript_12801:177-479(-)